MSKKFFTWEDCEKLVDDMVAELYSNIGTLSALEPLLIHGVPRGGIPVALMLKSRLGGIYNVQLVTDAKRADVIVDDIIDSGRTRKRLLELNPTAIFLSMISRAPEDDTWFVFPWEIGTEENGPEENVRRLIEFIGDDPAREGLLETPNRVIKSYSRLFSGYKQKPEDVVKVFEDGACKDMVVLKNIEMYSTCEHHMIPFFGKCHIAYIPNGKVIGVSKLARIMEIYARRLQIQERIGQQITSALEKLLNPLGAACIIEAKHLCMAARGVEKQNSVMVTSSLTGKFLDPVVRQELMSLIKSGQS